LVEIQLADRKFEHSTAQKGIKMLIRQKGLQRKVVGVVDDLILLFSGFLLLISIPNRWRFVKPVLIFSIT
jgi:hypothetical protein